MIERTSKIGDVVKAHPETAELMLEFGLHCVGCHVAYWETIEQGCAGHGMPDDMINELVEELNKLVAAEAQE